MRNLSIENWFNGENEKDEYKFCVLTVIKGRAHHQNQCCFFLFDQSKINVDEKKQKRKKKTRLKTKLTINHK